MLTRLSSGDGAPDPIQNAETLKRSFAQVSTYEPFRNLAEVGRRRQLSQPIYLFQSSRAGEALGPSTLPQPTLSGTVGTPSSMRRSVSDHVQEKSVLARFTSPWKTFQFGRYVWIVGNPGHAGRATHRPQAGSICSICPWGGR